MLIKATMKGLSGVMKTLDATAKQATFAAAVSLTKTGKQVEKKLQEAMRSGFKSASPYSLRGTFSTSATKTKLSTTIGIKDRKPSGGSAPAVLLKEHFGGGVRGPKPMEKALQSLGALPTGWRAVPGSAMRLDSYGNPSRRVVAEMLGSLSSKMQIARGRGKKMHLVGYFAVTPGANVGLAPGVYLRMGRELKCMLVFVRQATYRKLFDLPRLAQDVVDREFQTIFRAEMARAMRSAR